MRGLLVSKWRVSMQVWTSHYPVPRALSFIVTGHVHIWALSHYSSSVCPTWPRFLLFSDTHTHTHSCSKKKKNHRVFKQTKPLRTTIFIDLRKGEIVLQNTAYTLFNLLFLCLFYSPFLCSATFFYIYIHEHLELILQDTSSSNVSTFLNRSHPVS